MVTFSTYYPEEDDYALIDSIQDEHNLWADNNAEYRVGHPKNDNSEHAYVSVEHNGDIISVLAFTIIGRGSDGNESWWRGVCERHNGYKTELPTDEVKSIEHDITEFSRTIGNTIPVSYIIFHSSRHQYGLHNNNETFETYVAQKWFRRFVIPCQEYGYEFRANGSVNPSKLEEKIVNKTGLTADVTALSNKPKVVVEIPYDSAQMMKFVQGTTEHENTVNTVTNILSNNLYNIEWNLTDESSLLKKTREGKERPTTDHVYNKIEEVLQ